MPNGIGAAVALGLIIAAGVASRYLRRRRHPVTPAKLEIPVRLSVANESVEEVARWEDEGGTVVPEPEGTPIRSTTPNRRLMFRLGRRRVAWPPKTNRS